MSYASPISRFENAKAYATAAHESIGQMRRYGGLPYWTHPVRVAEIVSEYEFDSRAIVAAFLHDVAEDVTPENPAYSLETIREQFGIEIAAIVDGLTNQYKKDRYPEMNRKERKSLEHVRLAALGAHPLGSLIHTVKLADILANSEGHADLPENFGNLYLAEARALVPLLNRGNVHLRHRVESFLATL